MSVLGLGKNVFFHFTQQQMKRDNKKINAAQKHMQTLDSFRKLEEERLKNNPPPRKSRTVPNEVDWIRTGIFSIQVPKSKLEKLWDEEQKQYYYWPADIEDKWHQKDLP